MLCGLVASTIHSQPRTTQDVDVVVVLTLGSLRALLAQLPDDRYYVSEEAARDAVARRGMFNVIDLETGWKADLVIRKDRDFPLQDGVGQGGQLPTSTR